MLNREEQVGNQAPNNDREGLILTFLLQSIQRLGEAARNHLQPRIDEMFHTENGIVSLRLDGRQENVSEDEVREIVEDTIHILREPRLENVVSNDENIANLIGNFLIQLGHTLNNTHFNGRVVRLLRRVFGDSFDEGTPITVNAIERIFDLIIETLERDQHNG
ncbi:hypothetical protein GCK72_019651 [Caenorhabditis remanei]|uniref:Uncharacterized protein n=1 Tax=Caenorhabditis remanei TaxID=31234 RepID=A0A6A5GEI4_CAERE|nr:hypothetical protein GCK72_019651 [Caenorhabditis remanei]KAF1753095.1 hypothetical protein GCK72_019651 [Caenorhabditis remanei]